MGNAMSTARKIGHSCIIILLAFCSACAHLSQDGFLEWRETSGHQWPEFMKKNGRNITLLTGYESGMLLIPYSEFGPATSDECTVVLIHGTPGSKDVMAPLLMDRYAISDSCRVIVFDRFGHGGTMAMQPAGLSYEWIEAYEWPSRFSEEVLALDRFLTALPAGPEKFILIGHSYGGILAYQYAATRPSRVSRLVLIDTFGFFRPEGELPEADKKIKKSASLLRCCPQFARWGVDRRTIAKGLIDMGYDSTAAEAGVDVYYRTYITGTNSHAAVDLTLEELGFSGYSTQDSLKRVQCPVLLIWGSDDMASRVGRQACGMLAGLFNSERQLYVLKNCGHAPTEQCPQKVNLLLRSWLGQSKDGEPPFDVKWLQEGDCEVVFGESVIPGSSGLRYFEATTYIPHNP